MGYFNLTLFFKKSILVVLSVSQIVSWLKRDQSLQLLAGIQHNCMGTFNSNRRCAYRQLVPVRHFNSELWSFISYAVCIYRAIIVSVLLLCNYWLEFNETLWEPSIPRGDVQIVALFQSDTLAQSYGPWLDMHYAYRTVIVSALLLCNY
jgi:hypothetical protein